MTFSKLGLMAVLSGLAIALLAIACSGEPSPSGDTSGAPEAPAGEQSGGADRDLSGSDGSGGVGGPSTGGGLPLESQLDRKIVRTATLELGVEDVGAAVRQVETAATTAGGFVSQSNVFIDEPAPDGDAVEAPERTQTATVTIRVPAEAYAGVMEQLRGIAKEVTSERSEAAEVTEEYTDLQSRLRNLEATETSYLELLAKATAVEDILLVQDRLNGVRLEIEQVQGRINLLDSLTELATITVQLSVPAAGGQTDGGQNWAQEAWDAAWEASEDAAVALGSVAIVGGVLLLWLAIPAFVVFVVWRRFGSRPHVGPS
jgi:hypothetical protein